MRLEPNQPRREPVVAVVGATGAVGAEILGCLERRRFPLSGLRVFASTRSAGKTLRFRGADIAVSEVGDGSFAGIDIALFSAGSAAAKRYAPLAVQAGAVVIDNSSAFRSRPDVPLVVPEINGDAIRSHSGIIANPNCTAAISAMALWPIHRRNAIRRVTLASYQAASGAGAAAMAELEASTRAYLDGQRYEHRVFRHPYAFNLFSHDSGIDPETGYNGEELKVMAETKRILGDTGMRVSATCVRVPVLRAHSVALAIECEMPITPEEARNVLKGALGIRVVDDRLANLFPMPSDTSGQDDVLVGRIRRDLSDGTGRSLSLFACGDQILKGAALNAVQIAERLASGRDMPIPVCRAPWSGNPLEAAS
jgi:aspartate-semialdehyde dehydrogenase